MVDWSDKSKETSWATWNHLSNQKSWPLKQCQTPYVEAKIHHRIGPRRVNSQTQITRHKHCIERDDGSERRRSLAWHSYESKEQNI